MHAQQLHFLDKDIVIDYIKTFTEVSKEDACISVTLVKGLKDDKEEENKSVGCGLPGEGKLVGVGLVTDLLEEGIQRKPFHDLCNMGRERNRPKILFQLLWVANILVQRQLRIA